MLLSDSMNCRNGGYGSSVACDHGNTAISAQLPSDVSHTSDSGVFLSGSTVAVPEPEPETWAMMLERLGLMGAAVRGPASGRAGKTAKQRTA